MKYYEDILIASRVQHYGGGHDEYTFIDSRNEYRLDVSVGYRDNGDWEWYVISNKNNLKLQVKPSYEYQTRFILKCIEIRNIYGNSHISVDCLSTLINILNSIHKNIITFSNERDFLINESK